MTEQPEPPDQPDTVERSTAEGAGDGDRPHGTLRTEGETAVDDAIGSGDNVH
jgi:hypothetical protein